MNRFDAQTLAQSGRNGETFAMVFENAKGERFTVTVPHNVASAMVATLGGTMKSAPSAGSYATVAGEWRTARDMDTSHVFLEVKGHAPFVFTLASATALWQQVRDHCDEIGKRPQRRDS